MFHLNPPGIPVARHGPIISDATNNEFYKIKSMGRIDEFCKGEKVEDELESETWVRTCLYLVISSLNQGKASIVRKIIWEYFIVHKSPLTELASHSA